MSLHGLCFSLPFISYSHSPLAPLQPNKRPLNLECCGLTSGDEIEEQPYGDACCEIAFE
ncbi:hypothetical protein RchiOBHm_Chr7g0187111 [Rosa chinensis]|uniref:Uncharacterized protein n=1 Tax=Rosa chinensis TaxID=74649 RepID=A0A2P6P443_ROSCH|nr:hypothetical protein RchiOBHm_Chr7g0187111 [Rosa chinensis]